MFWLKLSILIDIERLKSFLRGIFKKKKNILLNNKMYFKLHK